MGYACPRTAGVCLLTSAFCFAVNRAIGSSPDTVRAQSTIWAHNPRTPQTKTIGGEDGSVHYAFRPRRAGYVDLRQKRGIPRPQRARSSKCWVPLYVGHDLHG